VDGADGEPQALGPPEPIPPEQPPAPGAVRDRRRDVPVVNDGSGAGHADHHGYPRPRRGARG
jgi:hypothetical protein